MKHWMRATLLVAVLGMLTSMIHAEEEAKAPKKDRPAPPPLEEMTLSGKVVEKTIERTKKDGTKSEMKVFALEDAEGKQIPLPVPRKVKGSDAAPIDLASYVGKNVTITAKGLKQVRKGKKDGEEVTKLIPKEITAIEEVAAP